MKKPKTKLGNYLQNARREAGISGEVLAEHLGISRQTVSHWERGISMPQKERLGDIAIKIGVDLEELRGVYDTNNIYTRRDIDAFSSYMGVVTTLYGNLDHLNKQEMQVDLEAIIVKYHGRRDITS